jgi:hypothetical protein
MSHSNSAWALRRALPALAAVCAFAAFLPSAAFADVPSATTTDVTVTGASTATVDGSVNPGGEATTYDVGYDLASSDWCQNDGQTGSPGNSTTSQQLGFTDTTDHGVSIDLTGLTPGTEYCAAVIASNNSGTVTSFPVTFGGPPVASTNDAFPTGATTATVEASVNPSGLATTYVVEYDVASSDWCQTGSGTPQFSTQPQSLGFTDTNFHDVSVNLIGLTPGTGYCADLVATNSSGRADGGQVFLPAALPNVFIDTLSNTATTAVVAGSVNPVGQTTSYRVEYALASSQWCSTFGQSGAPSNSTAPQPLGFTDLNDHAVSVTITGLTPATAYCADLVATNASGSGDSGTFDFTTNAAAPTVTLGQATAVGSTQATLTGTVNPSGLATTWHFEYGTTTNYGSSTPSNGAGSGAIAQSESVTIASLSPHATYHYRLVAGNLKGTTDSPDRTFTTSSVPIAPTVTTDVATNVSATGAMIHGTVNPNGLATTVHFEYGKTTSYGSSTQLASAGSGTTARAALSTLAGLSPNTTYHYRLVATSAAGTTDGSDRTFMTSARTRPPTPSARTRPPTLSHVALASSKFSARAGTRIRFTLSERARITIVITTKIAGHKRKPVKVATLRFAGAKGRNTHRFKDPNLRPGHYTATITARDTAGRASKPATLRFTILKS